MIPGSLYFTVFNVFLIILVIFKSIPDGNSHILSRDAGSIGFRKGLVVAIILVLYFGLRPLGNTYLGDTNVYANEYNLIKTGVLPSDFRTVYPDGSFDFSSEFLFWGVRNYFANAGFDIWLWFAYVAALYVILPLLAFRILMPGHEYLAMLFFISGFVFFSGGVNGIRNADGCSVFLLGLALISGRHPRFLLGASICLISYFFHHSLIICLIGLASSYFLIKSTKAALLVWFVAIAVSLAVGNDLANFASTIIDDNRAAEYLDKGRNALSMQRFSRTGFRWDFLLYSAMPIWLGWYVTVKKGIKDHTFQLLLNTYIIANAVWIVFIYAAYSNRFAMLSWSLYPIVLCYPLTMYNIWGNKQASRTVLILFAMIIFQSIL